MAQLLYHCSGGNLIYKKKTLISRFFPSIQNTHSVKADSLLMAGKLPNQVFWLLPFHVFSCHWNLWAQGCSELITRMSIRQALHTNFSVFWDEPVPRFVFPWHPPRQCSQFRALHPGLTGASGCWPVWAHKQLSAGPSHTLISGSVSANCQSHTEMWCKSQGGGPG